jgi:catechol 2,3-dioxygenase
MTFTIDPATRIGAVALSVGDLARSLDYYQQTIGLRVLERARGVATLGVAGAPLLHLREIPGARLVPRATGLYHFALCVPARRDLARLIRHFADTRTQIAGASDHLFNESVYMSDPDGHGVEISCDRPRASWLDARGHLRGDTMPLDLGTILGELGPGEAVWEGLPADTVMGHIHLRVDQLAAAERFYIGVLGFERTLTLPSACFVSAGRYHHHIAVNTWAGAGVPAPPEGAARLLSYEVRLPGPAALDAVVERVRAAGIALAQDEQGWSVRDPSHNLVLLRGA